MLGRLFRQGSFSNISLPPSLQPQPTDTYDDSHTRSILYGTTQPLKQPTFNPSQFRLIISQDGGSLRTKQVLYDSDKSIEHAKLDKLGMIADEKREIRERAIQETKDRNDALNLKPNEKDTDKQRERIKRSIPKSNDDIANNENRSNNDTTNDTTNDTPNDKSNIDNLNKSILPSKYLKSDLKNVSIISSYNLAELNDFMFGCGLPSNESFSITKIHILPDLNFKNISVLITHLFSISNDETSSVNTPDWNVTSTLPVNQNYSIQSKNSISSRFAIGLIVPIEKLDDIQDVILSNWTELGYHFMNLQKFILKKLISHLNTENKYYIINKRIQFTNHILQQDNDIYLYMLRFVKVLHFVNLPKLIDSNHLINKSITNSFHKNHLQFKSLLFNWVTEVLHWLNFKDGNDGFLPSLFALILPIKHTLAIKPYQSISKKLREVTRIVIMTTNPTIVKKLIFIINGLIPSDNYVFDVQSEDESESSMADDEEVDGESPKTEEPIIRNSSFVNKLSANDQFKKHHHHNKLPLPSNLTKIHRNTEKTKLKEDSKSSPFNESYFPQADAKSPSFELGTNPNSPIKPISIRTPRKNGSFASSYVGTPIMEHPSSALAKPIPMKNQNDNYGIATSYDNSPNTSSPSIKGWEIPGKATVATSVDYIETGIKTIPISTNKSFNRPLLNKLTSLAYLSTSLTSSLSSSTSKYSLNNFGGSFIDKWKNSLITQPNTPGVSFDEYFPPPLMKRNSIQSLKGTSPVIEHEGFNWQSGFLSLSTSVGKSQPVTPIRNSRPTLGFHSENNEDIAMKGQNLDVLRTNSGVYHPFLDIDEDSVEHNRKIIAERCNTIMTKRVSTKKVGDLIEVECLPREDDGVSDDEYSENCEYCEDEDDNEQATITSSKAKMASIVKLKGLNPNVSFTEEFRPEFNLQSCPPSNKLEQHIITTMKQDLLFYQNYFQYEAITTRTILVSLRGREIKKIEMRMKNNKKKRGSGTNLTASVNNTYHTKINKLFVPGKNNGNLIKIQYIEHIFNDINQLVNIHGRDEEYYENLKKLVTKLFECK